MPEKKHCPDITDKCIYELMETLKACINAAEVQIRQFLACKVDVGSAPPIIKKQFSKDIF